MDDHPDVHKHLGGFGNYQSIVVFCLSIIVIWEGITSMMLVFLLGDQNHRYVWMSAWTSIWYVRWYFSLQIRSTWMFEYMFGRYLRV